MFMSKLICISTAVLCVVVSVAVAGQCPLSSVAIDQTATGRSVASKPEWKVNITGNCVCTLTKLTLMCPKFLSTVKVRPAVITVDRDGHCIVKTRNLHRGESVVFTYAWDPIQFQPLNFNEACSS